MATARADKPIRHRKPINWGHIVLYIVLTAGAFLILLPFAYMLSTSVKNTGQVFRTPIEWPTKYCVYRSTPG